MDSREGADVNSLIKKIDDLENRVIFVRDAVFPTLEGEIKDIFMNPEKPVAAEDVVENVEKANVPL